MARLVPQRAVPRRPGPSAPLPGTFTLLDMSLVHAPPEEVSTSADKALANTYFLAGALGRFIQEMGPALKKLKTASDGARASVTPAAHWSSYQRRWIEATKDWLRNNVCGSQGMSSVWSMLKSREARRTFVISFFEHNNLDRHNAELESFYTTKANEYFNQFTYLMKDLYRNVVFLYPYITHWLAARTHTHTRTHAHTRTHTHTHTRNHTKPHALHATMARSITTAHMSFA